MAATWCRKAASRMWSSALAAVVSALKTEPSELVVISSSGRSALRPLVDLHPLDALAAEELLELGRDLGMGVGLAGQGGQVVEARPGLDQPARGGLVLVAPASPAARGERRPWR